MSYVGLWSYYNFDNWTYQPSYVSSNTPWFFNGMRIQIFPSDKLKIEPWLVNGWQSYGKFNEAPGVGLQIRWKPTEYFASSAINTSAPTRSARRTGKRIHTDDSVMVRFYNNPGRSSSQFAGSLTLDAGCEFGERTNIAAGTRYADVHDQYFLGFMAYARVWFAADCSASPSAAGLSPIPGRYLVLVPPINGATAFSGVSANLPNDPEVRPVCRVPRVWCVPTAKRAHYGVRQLQLPGVGHAESRRDYMPNDFITFRLEFNHRAASIPYFAGSGGMTPCVNGFCSNQGAAGSWPGQNGVATIPGLNNAGPDLSFDENRLTLAMMMKF